MRSYWNVVMLMNFLVDLLLLLTANRLSGYPQKLQRLCLGAALGGVYSGVCLLPHVFFLTSMLWRLVFLCLIGAVAYGCNRIGIGRWAIYGILRMALDGTVQGLENQRPFALVLGAVIFFLLSAVGLRGRLGQQKFVNVELWNGEKRIKLLALYDTGNGLRDPVTGQGVLVADAEAAQVLLGLTKKQLRNPIETVEAGMIPGLRLIPYRAVGQSAGMLVAIRLKRVKIGSWEGSILVAFAPEGLGENRTYRALIGGAV